MSGLLWSAGKSIDKSVASKQQGKRVTETVNTELRLVDTQDNVLTLEWICPEPAVFHNGETGEVTAIRMKGTVPLFETGAPELPMAQELLDCLPGAVSFAILESEVETANFGSVQPIPEDYIIDPREGAGEGGKSYRDRVAETAKKAGLWPGELVSLEEAGVFRGHRLVSLCIYPVQIDARSGSARILKRLRVQVTLPRSNTGGSRVPDSPDETSLMHKMLGKMAPTARPDRVAEHSMPRGNPDPVLDDYTGNRWKLIVNANRVTRVTGADLLFAGVPFQNITPVDLHIFNKGAEIPIHIVGGLDGYFDEADYFEFWSGRNEETVIGRDSSIHEDPYTQDNVYWMTWGDGQPGLRLGVEDGTWHVNWLAENVEKVRSSLHFEVDENFQRLGESSSVSKVADALEAGGPLGILQEYWFWDERIQALNSREFLVTIPFPYVRTATSGDSRDIGTPVILRAALHGFSWGFGSFGQHRAIVSINGVTENGLAVGKIHSGDSNVEWTGQTPIVAVANPLDPVNPNLTTANLLHGTNIIRVECPGDGMAGTNDQILVNWFEVEYDRLPRAINDFIGFRFDETRGDTFSLDIRGFSTPEIFVWKNGRSLLSNTDSRRVTPADESASWATRFNLIADDALDIIAFSSRHVRPPFMILPDSIDIDLRNQLGARYLLIVHDSFLGDPGLVTLDSLRRASFGQSVLTVPLSEVYDDFSYGIESPLAIRDFLKYAYENWTVRPTHACLVGDAVLRSRYNNNSGNLVPSIFAQTLDFGISASDVLFGCVSGPDWDILPDIAVGRISCRTSEELQTYVEKVYRYETQPDFEGLFQSRVLMVSDKKDELYNFVRDYSEPTIRLLPDHVNVARVYLDSLPSGQGYTELRNALRDGSVVVNYNGHGGGGVWSGTELINTEGVNQLTGQRTFPFVTNFTCYVGAFDDVQSEQVLGEAFIMSRNPVNNDLVGATGFYSSSGVGWAQAGRTMQQYLFDFLLDLPGLTTGEAAQINKTRFWASRQQRISFTSNYSMVMMMNLLGDPGLRLSRPQEEFVPVIAEPSNVVQHGDTIHVSGTLPWTPDPGTQVFLYALPYNGAVYASATSFKSWKFPAFDVDQIVPQFTESQTFSDLELRIESSFVTPRGRVVVYATDPEARRNVVGSFPIYLADSLESVQIFDVGTYPSPVILSDSTFQVRATVLHQDDIESVYLRGVFVPAQGPVVLDTMYMSEVEPGLWTSALVGPHHMQDGSYRVKFFIRPNGGDLFESEFYALTSQSSLDFSAGISNFEVKAGERPGKSPQYYLPLQSVQFTNSAYVPSLTVRLSAVSKTSVLQDGVPVTLVADSFTVDRVLTDVNDIPIVFDVSIPTRFRPQPYPYTITVTLDPDNEIEESVESNNTHFATLAMPRVTPVTRALGTHYYATALHPLATGWQRFWVPGKVDTFGVNIPPGQLPMDSATLIYFDPREITGAELQTLANNGMTRPIGQMTGTPNYPKAFRVTLGDTTETLSSTAQVQIEMSTVFRDSMPRSSFSEDIALFQRHAGQNAWWRLPNSAVEIDSVGLDSAVIQIVPHLPPQPPDTIWADRVVYRFTATGTTNHLGEFAIFRFNDDQGPHIDIAVGGMHFTQHSILPRAPEIYTTLSDPIGVDRGDGKFYIVIDGDTVQDWEMNWSDTLEWGGAVSAMIRPDLEPGEHTLAVFATDNVGNTSTTTAEFTVRGEFGIEWALNYPNPFEKTTTIAYVLTGATDDYVEIKIYTVSGRLIRTMRGMERESANYRTLRWDGRDQGGEEVANGVYFARIKAKREDQTVEKTVKMAKLR